MRYLIKRKIDRTRLNFTILIIICILNPLKYEYWYRENAVQILEKAELMLVGVEKKSQGIKKRYIKCK